MTDDNRHLDTEAELAAIQALPVGAKRERATSIFHTARLPVYQRFGVSLRRRFGVPAIHLDDVVQEITIVAMECVDTWDPAVVRHWEGWVWCRSIDRIRANVEAGVWDGVKGLSTRRRRVTKLNQSRDHLRHLLKREPTNEEIVEAHNTAAEERYTDARRQGWIATVDDLTDITPLSLSGVDTHGVGEHPMDIPVMDLRDDCILSPVESPTFVARIVERCFERSETLGTVAQAWLDGFGGEGEPIKSVPELAERLGRGYEQTRRTLSQVKEVAAEILAEEYGIGPDDAP